MPIFYYLKWLLKFVKRFFSAFSEIIIWFLLFSLFIWCITLTDLHVLKNTGITVINPTWSWCVIVVQSLVVSSSLQSYGLQHNRPQCPSPTPEVCPSSCSLNQWCHPAISSSDALFCPWSFAASGTFLCIRLPKYWSISFCKCIFRVDLP